MLVLTRAVGQRVLIRELGIAIQVLSVGRDKAQLGIEAPRNVAVHREEVVERIDSGEEPRRKAG